MLKFIDIAPLFIEQLPFPLGRFQAEGGEHVNYEHNMFFYSHTTRRGCNSPHPFLSIFCNMYKRISYQIALGDGTTESKLAATQFEQYKKTHLAAYKIQKWWGALKKHSSISADAKIQQVKGVEKDNVLQGKVFILHGSVPKVEGKSYTQSQVETLIRELGVGCEKNIQTRGSTCLRNHFLYWRMHLFARQSLFPVN